MDKQKLTLSISILALGCACLILGLVAIIIPHWANFRSRVQNERGSFGPWTVCKDKGFGTLACGPYVSNFKPTFAVYAAGICGAVGMAGLGTYCILSLIQMIVLCGHAEVMFKYLTIISIKLVVSVVPALLGLVSICLFATQGDDLERGYIVEYSIAFYMQIIVVCFSFVLTILNTLEFMNARRFPEDTFLTEASDFEKRTKKGLLPGTESRAQVNGGAKGKRSVQTNGISMTDSSVRFVLSNTSNGLSRLALARQLSSPNKSKSHHNNNSYKISFSNSKSKACHMNLPNGSTPTTTNHKSPNTNESHGHWNGSVTSLSPASNGSSISVVSSLSTVSTLASVSSIPHGPLRSSLKKSKSSYNAELGIQNPGFSGTSPTLSRTGSLKKVRIQTQSTDV